MEKTLGGDRLGSGKKMKVFLHGFERSTHDLSYLWRSTMSSGTLVPFIDEIGLPGDTFDINLQCEINTHPTIGPLFGSYKVQLDVFQAPIRLYNAMLHNNALNIGRNMSVVKFPLIELTAIPSDLDDETLDVDNSQINPSSLLAYLGIRGIGHVTTITGENKTRQFNALSILTYWDTYKNYYANKQEEIGAVLHTPATAIVGIIVSIGTTNPTGTIPLAPAQTIINTEVGTEIQINWTTTQPLPSQIIIHADVGSFPADQFFINFVNTGTTLEGLFDFARWGQIQLYNYSIQEPTSLNNGKPSVATFPLANIDTMRETILQHAGPGALIINGVATPYTWLSELVAGVPNVLSSQEGLALKTYQSDLFNNWISTEWIDGVGGITEVTAVDTSGGSFTLDTLNLSKKVYNMLNRIAVSGGSYNDWVDVVYDHDRYQLCETPMYMGGLIKELVFQEVVSNSESNGSGGTQPLGTLAGKGVMSQKHKGGHIVIKVDEPSIILGIISLTPRIDYSQGNKWHVNLKTMDDLHKPNLDEIGFQELITEQMAWWDTEWVSGAWVQKSAGKQPAWINYMTNVNKAYGNFAISDNEMFMTLNRRYEANEADGIVDLTTYIDPSKYNHIFAQTALDAQNFWVQIAVDMIARRKMSARIMPNV